MDSKETEKTAENLKRIRLEKGLSQTDLADKAGINSNYYSKIERSDLKPSIDVLEKIAKAYHEGNNNETLNNEPFINIVLRKLMSALESGERLPLSTKVVESTVVNHETPIYEHPDQVYERIATHILKFESLSDNNKLTKSTIKRFQKQLDKISAKYDYDETLDHLYFGLYELQACIHKSEGDNEAAIKFLTEAAEIKPHNVDFVSRYSQDWYSHELRKAAASRNDMYKQSAGKQRKFSRRAKIIASSFVGAVVLLIFLANPISEYITIKSANPTMLKLAQDAGMSREGEVLFLRTNPQLDSDTQILKDCPVLAKAINGNGGILQGCYDPTHNRIYLRKMPSDLYNLEIVTAAYEMLHPVYLSLYNTSQPQLNHSIESNYSSKTANNYNPDLVNTITSLVAAEPGDKDLELFSLLGTQFSDLTSELSTYYASYFTNMGKTTAAYQSIQDLFSNDQYSLNNLKSIINNEADLAQKYDNAANTAYYNSTTWAAVGNQYENDRNYNIYLQDYNSYKTAISNENYNIDRYNQLLQTYNTLVRKYNGTQPVNQIQNVQSQQQH